MVIGKGGKTTSEDTQKELHDITMAFCEEIQNLAKLKNPDVRQKQMQQATQNYKDNWNKISR